MDVVEISGGSASADGRRPRAMVIKTQGVPGLNKISVRLVFPSKERCCFSVATVAVVVGVLAAGGRCRCAVCGR